MHLLRESGLASAGVKAEINALAAPHGQILVDALEQGTIRGPSVGFISDLIFNQIDLVIEHNLHGTNEELAFDMLCHSIGLVK